MWIVSTLGFFSIVRHKTVPGAFLVRARAAGDLERGLAAAGLPLAVTTSPEADYRFRATLDAGQLTALMTALQDSITYPNFKNADAADPGQRPRLGAYHEVWHTLQMLQENP